MLEELAPEGFRITEVNSRNKHRKFYVNIYACEHHLGRSLYLLARPFDRSINNATATGRYSAIKLFLDGEYHMMILINIYGMYGMVLYIWYNNTNYNINFHTIEV